MNYLKQLNRKYKKLRLQPIRVYCLHHVCAQFDAEWMNDGDWMAIDEFKRKVSSMLQRDVVFISLAQAYEFICNNDWIRRKKYVVLTFDDGYASLAEILPWLKEQNIPVTLFVNPDYALGKAYRKTPKEQYLSIEALNALGIEIGMHGLQHIDVSEMPKQEFDDYFKKTMKATNKINGFIPFWAYTWGKHNCMIDEILLSHKITPVLIDGLKNYDDASCIHRELLR